MSVLDIVFICLFLALFLFHILSWWDVSRQRRERTKDLRIFFANWVTRRIFDRPPQKNDAALLDILLDEVREILENDYYLRERKELLDRIHVKAETAPWLVDEGFWPRVSLVLNMAEVYPLLGILGTVVSLWFSQDELLSESFLTALWTTALGLVLGMITMIMSYRATPLYERFREQLREAEKLVTWAKRVAIESQAASEQEEIENDWEARRSAPDTAS